MYSSKIQLTVILLWILAATSSAFVQGQSQVAIEGAIKIGTSEDPSPDAGTIAWDGSNYLGYNGSEWKVLTLGKQYISDIEHNRYEIVTIGSQVWMAENLQVTRYNDGTAVDLVLDDNDWFNLSTGGYTWYDNTSSPYGALYNFYVIDHPGNKNICPIGWHVPNQSEWFALFATLTEPLVAGGKMKETGLEHWHPDNFGASNEMGFRALPGGSRSGTSIFGFFSEGIRGLFWSSTAIDNLTAYAYSTEVHTESVVTHLRIKKSGFSIRCVKDD